MSAAARLEPKPKKFIDGERRRVRSDDPETALSFQLEAVVQKTDVDVLVVADFDGAPIASAGDPQLAMDLAQLGVALLKELPLERGVTTTRGFVHVDRVRVGPRDFVVAALRRASVPDPIGMARAVHGAARILAEGLPLVEAPLPLSVRGSWGDWDEIP